MSMFMILLTNKEIHDDIRAFKERILDAQSKLESLPDKTKRLESWEMKKKVEKQRRELIVEINHVYSLIKIAREGLDSCEKRVS